MNDNMTEKKERKELTTASEAYEFLFFLEMAKRILNGYSSPDELMLFLKKIETLLPNFHVGQIYSDENEKLLREYSVIALGYLNKLNINNDSFNQKVNENNVSSQKISCLDLPASLKNQGQNNEFNFFDFFQQKVKSLPEYKLLPEDSDSTKAFRVSVGTMLGGTGVGLFVFVAINPLAGGIIITASLVIGLSLTIGSMLKDNYRESDGNLPGIGFFNNRGLGQGKFVSLNITNKI